MGLDFLRSIVFLGRFMKKKDSFCDAVPKYFYDSLTDIAPSDIFAMGGRAIGLDLDNTCCFDSSLKLFKGVDSWLADMKNAGIPIIIISNTYPLRARLLSKKMGGLPYIANARKPKPSSFAKAAAIAGADLSQLVVIGDRLFTDALGANRAGAISVRVKYKKREILQGLRYTIIRRKEKKYLIDKGLGDKI